MVPLIFDLVLLSGLFNLLLRAEQLALEAEHERTVAAQVDIIFEHLSRAAAALSANPLVTVVPDYAWLPVQVKRDVSKLKQLTSKNPREFAGALRVEAASNAILDTLDDDRFRLANDSIEFPLGYLNTRQQLGDQIVYLKSTMDSVYPPEQKDELKNAALASDMRLKIAIVAGFVVNLLLALSLTVYYNRGTTRRLTALMNNTVALSTGQDIAPAIGGTDEIAQLDKTFHDMANSLKEAERLKAEFTAMITHDLRSPLSTIRTFLELIETEFYGPCPPELSRYAVKAKVLVDRLAGLADDILCLERMEAGELTLTREESDLSQIIDESLHAVSGAASEAGVTVCAKPSTLRLAVDRRRLTQVLINLLSNAIKFSPRGATVVLEGRESDDHVIVEITDSGPGVADAEKELIFEKFKQGPSSASTVGTGLGLAICKMIIEQHGGMIGIKDGVEGGSVFWFKLPKQAELSPGAIAQSNLRT